MSLKILQIEDTCTGCGACVSACPKQALALSYNKEGFYYPRLDEAKCVDCKLCEKVCHVLSIQVPEFPSRNYNAYMIKAKNKEIVKKSSSGGVFSLLADEVLKQGGVVYGARYSFENERLEQMSTEHCSLAELRKSKYIESYMGDTCKDIAAQLKNGRKVLFCGTPCQVDGISQYLKVKHVDRDNLVLVRFVCHGVPSNRFFSEYKLYEEKKHNSKMVSFDFRPKTNGWRGNDWKMEFKNGISESGPYYYFYYYYCFELSNLLRSSCYSCNRIYHELTDFTIADFWGIQTFKPENNDQEGISFVLTHSDKANNLLQSIRENCELEQIPHSAIDYIYREVESKRNLILIRNELMNRVMQIGYMNVAKKILKRKILKKQIKIYLFKKLNPLKKWLRKK